METSSQVNTSKVVHKAKALTSGLVVPRILVISRTAKSMVRVNGRKISNRTVTSTSANSNRT